MIGFAKDVGKNMIRQQSKIKYVNTLNSKYCSIKFKIFIVQSVNKLKIINFKKGKKY